MAEGKKSFIAYVDWKDTFDNLPDDKAGQLIKHLFAYVSDENPKTDDVLINAVFANIKQTLKRDLRKYETIREKRVIAGKASADKRQQVSTSVDKCEHLNPVNVSVNVNDSVNDNEEIRIEFEQFWNLYNKKVGDKSKCLKKWVKLKDDDRQKIFKTLPLFLSSIKDKQFQPFPETYINQHRWNDEIPKQAPVITDINGNPRPSNQHTLVNGKWTVI